MQVITYLTIRKSLQRAWHIAARRSGTFKVSTVNWPLISHRAKAPKGEQVVPQEDIKMTFVIARYKKQASTQALSDTQ